MTEEDEISILKRLDSLRNRHRNLDTEIESLEKHNIAHDQFALHRLKKEKLGLRDQILSLERLLYPDIIA